VLSEFQHKTNGAAAPMWNKDYVYALGKTFGLVKNQIPAGPQKPWATAISSTGLTVNWNAVAESDILGYAIESRFRLDANHNEMLPTATSVPASPTHYTHTFPLTATTSSYVRYKIYAVDTAANVSEPSKELVVRPHAQAPPPNPPTGLVATAGDRTVALQWSIAAPVIAGANDIAGYYVEREDVPAGPYARLNIGYLLQATAFIDTALDNGHSYTYQVRAVDTQGRVSAQSNTATVVPGDGIAPGRPAEVFAEPDRTAGRIHISWKKNPEGDIGQYRVYRNLTAGSAGNSVGTVGAVPGQVVYDFYDPIDSAATYFYSVSAVDTWKSPVLFIHGDDDRNVYVTQTVDLVARLRSRGVEIEQLIFPDEIHDFLLHKDWLAAYRATADFFDRKLNGGKSPAETAAH
jgi:hypothetical protein